MLHVIANLLWIFLLAIVMISILGWFALVYVIGFVGIVFSVIYQNDKKKLAITLVLTAIAVFAWFAIYMACEF